MGIDIGAYMGPYAKCSKEYEVTIYNCANHSDKVFEETARYCSLCGAPLVQTTKTVSSNNNADPHELSKYLECIPWGPDNTDVFIPRGSPNARYMGDVKREVYEHNVLDSKAELDIFRDWITNSGELKILQDNYPKVELIWGMFTYMC